MALRVTYSKSNTEKDDAELWSDFKAGDREAFSFIYYQNAKVLLNYALKITTDRKLIEDCMQEMFLDLWNKRATLPEVSKIRNYLFTALRRRILKSIKAEKAMFSINEDNETPDFEWSFEKTMITDQADQERREKLHKSISKLSPLQKEIIYLKYFNSFSFEEIASILKTNKKTVYNALSKSMIKLRKGWVSLVVALLFFQ